MAYVQFIQSMRFYSYLLKLESLVFSGVGNSLDKNEGKRGNI